MKNRTLTITSFLILIFTCSAFSQQQYELIKEPELQKEIIALYQRDQAIRGEIFQNGRKKKISPAETEKLNKLNRYNVKRLRVIIKKHGWPGISLVGQIAEGDAWALVQHADIDPAFQKECLRLLSDAYKKGDTKGLQLAFLTDHLRVKEGKRQIYGTQAKIDMKNRKFTFLPIEDSTNVDKRRDKVGLMPLNEYYKILMNAYFPGKK